MAHPIPPHAREADERLRFETLLADLAAEFVHLPANQVDAAITNALRRLVGELGVERSSLVQLTGPPDDLETTHYWSHPDFPPIIGVSLTRRFPWVYGQITAGNTLCLETLDQVPEPDRTSAQDLGIKSNVTIPLRVGERVIGALTFATLRHERRWAPELVDRFRLIAQVFANALARKRSDDALQQAMAEVQRLRDRLRQENDYLRQEIEELHGPTLIIGRSPAIKTVIAQAEQVAATSATVLLLGETGTGKELFATQIHEASPRRERMMVRVNCAAIPSALIESELFGREKGAYTGALSRQAGRFEVAHRSTIFLDEIGDLPLETQVKLLRVLESRQIERLGSSTPTTIDVRIIAATNRDLEKAIASGTFREDLYYRLNVFPLRVPPLRERPDDIPLLVWRFVDEFGKAFGKQIDSVSKENMLALQRYGWPGNVRELRNVVERAVIMCAGPRLTIDLPASSIPATRQSIAMVDMEREHIREILERVGWRVRGTGGAAELLRLKPSTLESRMVKLGIQRPPRQ